HRSSLVEVARAKAEGKYGTAFAGPATVLVGDTPLDVPAGRAGGARVVPGARGRGGRGGRGRPRPLGGRRAGGDRRRRRARGPARHRGRPGGDPVVGPPGALRQSGATRPTHLAEPRITFPISG